jgi:hypothetical protein
MNVDRPTLVVLVEPEARADEFVKSYLGHGGTVLIVPKTATAAMDSLKQCGLADVSVAEATVKRDAMLGDIDFEHPLFAPFAESQFSDFTGIRFWKHRSLTGFGSASQGRSNTVPHEGRVLARFDDGDPAFVEFAEGKGRVWLLTGGWHPADSQLARSSKFPPLVFRMLEQASGAVPRTGSVTVGTPIAWSRSPVSTATNGSVRSPDGSLKEGLSAAVPFSATNDPGLYALTVDGRTDVVAVNVAPDESRTSPLPIEQLEALGVRFGAAETPESTRRAKDRQRQLRLEELEQSQKLWRWGILIAVVMLMAETWIAGRRVTQSDKVATE